MEGAPVDENNDNDDGTASAANARTAESIGDAPLPTAGKLRSRQNVAFQAWRFVRINLRMLKMIASGHDS
jgi:hypothetical protein